MNIITDHLDIWSSVYVKKATTGRGRNGKISPYGIQKLRELILELAVRGKLVPQDPNDEPACVLLEKIAEERVGLLKEGIIKKQKTLSPITEKDQQFQIPSGWAVERFGNLAIIERGGSPRPIKSYLTDDPDGLNWIKIGDTDIGGKYITSTKEKIVKEGLSKTRMVYPGDFLLTNSMSFGRPYITKIQGCIHDGWLRISPATLIDKDYLYWFLTSPFIKKALISLAAGAVVQNLNSDKVREVVSLVPPIEEQHRIVAKVDELMAICDQLEQQQADSITAHQTLVETLLNGLLHPVRPEPALRQAQDNRGTAVRGELVEPQAWSRIAEHIDTLFTTEHSIDQLKQTILQLAIMGKLVPQDPNDETASVLLEKITEEKARLVKEGKLKKQKTLLEIDDAEKPFDLLVAWEWARFDDLVLHSEAGWSPKCKAIPRDGDEWGVLKVSAVSWGKYDPAENKALPEMLEPRSEYEVKPRDFLISRANTADLVARAVVVPEDTPPRLMMSDKIIRFAISPRISSQYLCLVNSSRFSRDYYARVAGGTSSSMKNVSREQIRKLIVALPPLAEQHRIVTKVDELMGLCDALKARIQDTQTTQVHLADAIVEQAVA